MPWSGAVRHPRRTAGSVVKGAAGVAGLARAALRPAPDTPYNTPVGPARSFSWQRESLDEVKAVKDALGGSVNDVVLTAVAGALDRDLRRRGGHPGDGEMYAFVPVSLRADSGDGQLGNEVSGLKVALPLGRTIRSSGSRACTRPWMRSRAARRRWEPAPRSTPPASCRPRPSSRWPPVGDVQRYVNLVITNVPGPSAPLYFLGRELEDVFPFVPLGASSPRSSTPSRSSAPASPAPIPLVEPFDTLRTCLSRNSGYAVP